MERKRFPLCRFCGDRIGVYEPTIALEPAGARLTSLAREPDLGERDRGLMHRVCAELDGVRSWSTPTEPSVT